MHRQHGAYPRLGGGRCTRRLSKGEEEGFWGNFFWMFGAAEAHRGGFGAAEAHRGGGGWLALTKRTGGGGGGLALTQGGGFWR